MVEDLIEAVVDEPDADRTDDDSTVPEDTETADDFEREGDDGRVQRDDVERQPVEQELR